MSWGQSAIRITKRLGPVVSAVCAGLSAVLLLWSPVLALWSWLGAEPSPALGAWQKFHYSPWGTDSLGAGTPRTIALTLCWISGALLVSLLVTWLLRFAHFAAWSVAALLGAVALGLMYLRSGGLAEFVGWMQHYPHTAQLPAALTAWRLAALALVLLIIGSPAYLRLAQRTWREPATAGVVFGLVLAAGATGIALYAGNDSRFVDASVTTVSAPDLPVPAALGRKHFSVQIASVSAHNNWYVQPIVGGFVTVGDGRVTAFDGKGNERWHYRRSGPSESQVTSLRVFDDGRTVIAGLGSYPSVLIGFDAESGRQLWWSSDQLLIETYRPAVTAHVMSPRTYLMRYDGKAPSWTRFDTRTGTPIWTATVPEPQCPNRFDAAGRPTQVLLWCPGGPDTVRFISLNPDDGESAWETTFSPDPPFNSLSAAPAGRDGTVVLVTRDADHNSSIYIDASTKLTHQLATPLHPIDTIDDAVDFLALAGGGLSLRGPEGTERCTFSSGPLLPVDGKAVILKDQIVFGMSPGLQTFTPNTCAPLTTSTLSSVPEALIAAPGVVLVVRTDSAGTWVDGYA